MADAPRRSRDGTRPPPDGAPPERPPPHVGPGAPDQAVALAVGELASVAARPSHARWADVWARAVILPAWRRAAAVWVGCAIVGAVIFGPTGMQPSDLTGLALHDLGIAGVLAVTWLLVFAPIARLIVRADAAAYLRSLPGSALVPLVIGGGAVVVLQLPWLALWVIGDGLRGLAIVALGSLVLAALARWRPPVVRAGWPAWRDAGGALRAVHLRAVRRRAGDALVRGAGLAVLAGVAAGLVVRNNGLVATEAAVIGGSVISVVLVPAHVGVLMVILQTHRSTAWLAASLGIARGARIAALVVAIAVVQVTAAAIAVAAAALVAEPTAATLGWLAGTTVAVAACSALGCARALLGAEDAPAIAARTVVGAIVVAAIGVLCLGTLGVTGLAAFAATSLFAILTVPG